MADHPDRSQRPPTASPYPTAALLNDLLGNTLDPGYRAAADRAAVRAFRGEPDPPVRWAAVCAWVGCLAIGLILTMAYQAQRRAAPSVDTARQDLINRIHSVEGTGNSLAAQQKTLTDQVAALRAQQLAGTGLTETNAEKVAAADSAVHGPGMTVLLADPTAAPSTGPTRPGTVAQNEVGQVTWQDIRAVVNVLWSAGAEAIEINGIRLTATSFVRFAGESVVVDFQHVNSPYTISAIGNRNQLPVGFAGSPIARQLKTKQGAEGISFAFNSESDVTLPAAPAVSLNYALRGSR